MSTEKILPIDLYHAVSTANLTLESSLKIIHVEAGQDYDLFPMDAGTLAVICRGGRFVSKALDQEFSITAGQILLAATDDIKEISRFSETGFEGVVIYASSDLLINRQRLMYRDITPDEMEETDLYIRLIQSQIERMSDVRVKVVESLLRALIFYLQQGGHVADDRDSRIPPMFYDFALLISRYHHYPVYYYAEKLGMTSMELNSKCKSYSGVSAAEWISQYVLLEAKDLLIKTRLRPSRIAVMLNFSNYDTFARWFRRHTGELPGNWR
ncbi:AraC family transcriptional regulator [Parabacteroides sp. AF48-14]|uniref:helix-turn-helix domain-containing protein n=1 Tax=Parabacteroides sp. AF48-14 TaxID=2292052 RepID=UPI000EFE2D81|nr:helix-turn-helix domain-containing protein [Parabacteroides sp. AF48-14]RHO67026.1 AraC family transcriptional regulator [Parabacteroides sp. AF48-14]